MARLDLPASGCRVAVPSLRSLEAGAPAIPTLARAGRYDLLLPVARGGMGAVWAARLKLDSGFEKLFAVKTLLPHLATDRSFRAMFLDEARIAAGIEHPNVAQVVDIGEEGDLLYFVLEWVEGESLHGLARAAATQRTRIPLGVALRVLADACAGLHAAHEHADLGGRALGIVHRDVSPHNILISAPGATKLIDFGVAQANGRTEDASPGQIKGKVRFMAPEQACGRKLDRRADVWAIGAVLYKLVTGRYPYAGETDVDFLRLMQGGCLPDPVPEAVASPLARVMRRALAFMPCGRHPTAAALAEDLDAAAIELGVLSDARDVAATIATLSRERFSAQRAAIKAAIDARESLSRRIFSDAAPSSLSSASLTSGTSTPPPSVDDSHDRVVVAGALAEDATRVDPPRSGRWVRLALGAAVAASVAATAAAAISARGPRESPTNNTSTNTARATAEAVDLDAPATPDKR